jgi:hypothetical protein
VSNRVTVYEPVAFTGGKLWHSFVEERHVHPDRGIDELSKELFIRAKNAEADMLVAGREKSAGELMSTWTALEQAMPFYEDQYPGETVAVETPIRKLLGVLPNGEEVWVQGIPDRVKRYDHQLQHVQTRTLDDSTPLVPYLESRARDLHELIYAWLIVEEYHEPYFGTEMQILRKLKLWSDRKCSKAGTKWHEAKSRPDCEECHYEGRVRTQLHEPAEAFVHRLVPIEWTQVRRAQRDVMRIAARMQAIRAGEEPEQVRSADRGKFGNSLCTYFGVCNETAELDDETLFKARESRYEGEL